MGAFQYVVVRVFVIAAVAVAALVAARGATADVPGLGSPALGPAYDLAHRCVTIRTSDGPVGILGDTYTVGRGDPKARFYLQPTQLGRFLLQDQDGQVMSAGNGDGVTRQPKPRARSVFAIDRYRDSRDAWIRSARGGGSLGTAAHGSLVLRKGNRASVRLRPAHGCKRFPEAPLQAHGKPHSPLNPNGTVFGFADSHLHITANFRAGGRVIDGEPFDRFGIPRALGRDAHNHGPDGSEDVTGNLLRTGLPFGTHDTHGWPTFKGWPVHDTNTHQQTYYRWLQRAWKAGERVVVAQTVEDATDVPDRAASARTPATRRRRSPSEDPRAAGARALRRRAERRPGQGLFPARLQPCPGAAGRSSTASSRS